MGELAIQKRNFTEAIKYFRKSGMLFSNIRDTLFIAKSSLNMADIYESLQKPDSAIKYYNKSLLLFENLKDLDKQSLIYTNLGIVCDYIGDYSNAMRNYVKSFEIDKSLKNTDSYGVHLNNIGQVFTSLKLNKKAIDYLTQSVKASGLINDTLTMCYAYVGLNNAHLNAGNIKAAEDFINKAIDLQSKLKEKDYFLLSLSYTDLGRVFISKNQFLLAEKNLKTAFEIGKKYDHLYCKLYALGYTAQLHNQLNEFSKAESTSKLALSLLSDVKLTPVRITILNQLKETYARQQLFDKAYQIQEEIHDLNRLNTYEIHVKNISELSANLDLSQEKRINDLRVSKQREELMVRIEKQKIIIFFTILVLACLGVLAINSIKNHNNQKQINNALMLKNKEIEANRKEIDKQSRDLVQLNEYKDVIFTIISHDLRKPLGHLSSILELLENHIIDEQDLKTVIPHISKNVKNTSQILDSLLVWAKSQLKGFNLKFKQVNLFEFVNNRIETLVPFAKEKNINIYNTIDPSVNFYTDALLVTIIIRNLVLNSIKYSNDSQNIYIGAEIIDNYVFIQVKDEGIGMDQEQLNSLFGPQTKTTLGTKKEQGTGLGLFFCRDLVKKSGGKLSVKSKLNQGTTVTFSVPYYLEMPLAEEKDKDSSYIVS
ncbi:tetratricopeptide repeat-containing sensor histidine kinase [Pseudopedobacter saltans]|nr:tetratricopeptide repeat-containing sensor histidine kinase [Pseudopedobacter saltans]